MTRTTLDGLLVIDKPGGMTSRDVVNRVQGCFPRGTRLGHTGTLDPLATGVLVLCAGQATRLAEYVQAMSKVYSTRLLLGRQSTTDDIDGEVEIVRVEQAPEVNQIHHAIARFIGEIEQTPPAFSAAKVTGRRAYKLARAGDPVALQPRTVRIYDIQVRGYTYPHLELEVHCGKGTYIRSLARDLGKLLRCGALVETLRRVRVGPFTADDAISLDADAQTVQSHLLPLEAAVAELTRVDLQAADIDRLRHGQPVVLTQSFASGESVAVFDPDGKLVAVTRASDDGRTLHPEKVLAGRSRP